MLLDDRDNDDETPSAPEPDPEPEPESKPESKQEDKVEDGSKGQSNSDSGKSENAQSEQITAPEPKLVKPGTVVAAESREQSTTPNVGTAKEFKPKSGPHFLKRLRRPPETTMETN